MQRVRRAMLGWPLLALPGLARAQAPSGPATDPGEVIPLWPRGPPGGVPSGLSQRIVERGGAQGQRDRAVSGITRPTLTVFRPPNTKGRGCVLVVPGGGYERVLLDREGFEIARWLSRRDITAYVLTYRLPGEGWAAGRDAPLQDVQRAIPQYERNTVSLDLAARGRQAEGSERCDPAG